MAGWSLEHVERMRAAIAPMSRREAIGYLRRRPGATGALLAALVHAPDGGPPDYPAAVASLRAYGAYLVAAADMLEGKT